MNAVSPCSSVWIEHETSNLGVAGSNPVKGIGLRDFVNFIGGAEPLVLRGGGTVVTATGCSPVFRGFESHPPL